MTRTFQELAELSPLVPPRLSPIKRAMMFLKNISLAKNSDFASLSSSKHLSHKARPGASKQSIACLASSNSNRAPGSNAFENRPIPA